jgi:ADP-dependent phosphofructokinase/glucokinase
MISILEYLTKRRIELELFAIGTIVVPKSIWSNQLVKLITSIGLNLVEHVIKLVEPMFEPHVSYEILVKSILIRHVKIVIPPSTFQQHLP